MPGSVWKPHTTVAAMCCHEGRFLLVKEKVAGKNVFNQPAGHLEANESLLDAVIRETLEETQYDFTPSGLLGIYRSIPQVSPDITYIRFLFCGTVGPKPYDVPLDEGIISAEWMSYDEVIATKEQHRSPLVLQCIEDYLYKSPFSLEVISSEFR